MKQIFIENVQIHHIPYIMEIAEAAWRPTYLPIISEAQVDFMFKLIFTPKALEKNLLQPGTFALLAFEDSQALAFAVVSPENQPEGTTKISKFYVRPDAQGKGIGKKLMNDLIARAKAEKFKKILLNVNRFNEKAIFFYEKCNFVKLYQEDIAVGKYWMNDFVMGLDV
ncbi:MAG: GNAT family N-acetyltransferase [Verrucomicrobia bacterium]|nr:GNAT family N-acetyltransferase [Cytophagales bacterium]